MFTFTLTFKPKIGKRKEKRGYGENPQIGDFLIKNEAFPYGQNRSNR